MSINEVRTVKLELDVDEVETMVVAIISFVSAKMPTEEMRAHKEAMMPAAERLVGKISDAQKASGLWP